MTNCHLCSDRGLGTNAVVMEGGLVGRIDRAAKQLAAAMAARPSSAPRDPFADPEPFENLLPRRPSA